MAKKSDAQTREEDTLEDAAEPRVYELGFHLDPELPTEEAKKVYQAMRGVVAEAGEIVAEGEPEKIQLAYSISRGGRDYDAAYFSWIAYEAEPQAHARVVSAAGEESRIIRFIDLVTSKEAARHAAELRALAAPTSLDGAPEAAPEAALDAALESAAL